MDRSNKGLAQNTGFVLAAELLVQATRAVTVFVLLDVFDPEEFAAYAAILALTTLLGPVSQWGMNHVGVRAIARDVPFADTWAKVTSSVAVGGVLGTAVAVIIAWLIYDVPLAIVWAFGLAQLVGFGTAQAATLMTEAHHRSDIGLRINIAGGVVRIGLLVLFVGLGFDRLEQWALFLLIGMLVWGAVSAIQVSRAFGGRFRLAAPTREDLGHGFGFVFVLTSASGQTDIDKVVLEANGLSNDLANYSPGYRIAELTTVPLIALVRATYAEFFRRGKTTITEAMSFAKGLTVIATGYGALAGVGLLLFAPLVNIVIDEAKLPDTVNAVRWLAFIPIVKGLQYFPGNALTGSDHHKVRSWIIFITAAVNLIGNLIFIPGNGWRAAAVTTLVSEVLFAVLLWAAAIYLSSKEEAALETG